MSACTVSGSGSSAAAPRSATAGRTPRRRAGCRRRAPAARLHVRGQHGALQQGVRRAGGVVVRERRERERGRVRLAAAPARRAARAARAARCRRPGAVRPSPSRRGRRRSRAARRRPSADPRRRARGRSLGEALEEPAPGGGRLGAPLGAAASSASPISGRSGRLDPAASPSTRLRRPSRSFAARRRGRPSPGSPPPPSPSRRAPRS